MNLYLLRHAIAEEAAENQPDSERALTEKGRRKLQGVLSGLQTLELRVDYIFSSPYLRAHQTAELAASAFGLPPERLVETGHLSPLGFADLLIEKINREYPGAENILLVGHEPSLSQLISILLGGEPGLPITMKKAGVCKLSTDRLSHNRCARLEWLLTPAQLIKIGWR